MKLEFCGHVCEKKNIQIPNFMKIRQVGAKCGTDRHYETNSRFSQFCEGA